MNDECKNFFYQGRLLFEKDDDFLKFVVEYSLKETTDEDLDMMFEQLKDNIKTHKHLYKYKFKNEDWICILEDTLFFILNHPLFKK